MSESTPRVFVSATSKDLGEVRAAISDMLVTMGCLPVEQTKFPPDYRSVREMLRARIEGCQSVIHIVGRRYGAEPDPKGLPPGAARQSYTQMEYHLARELKKKVFTFVCGDDFPYGDAAIEPEPAELRALQDAHRAALLSSDSLRYEVNRRGDLDNRIRELQIKLEEVITQEKALRRRLTGALVAAVLVLLLGGGAIWFRLSRLPEATANKIDKTVAPIRDDVRRTATAVEQTHAAVGEIHDAATQTSEGVMKLNATMTVAAAQAALQAAVTARDGALSGQVEAIQTLIAMGHTFTGSDLSGISLQGAKLPGAKFNSAKLHAIDLSETQAPQADFSETGLRFAKLDDGQFKQAKFAQAYAPFITAKKAEFSGADLSEGNFTCGDFQDADFRGANLRGTCFAFADLRGAHFDNADLTGTYLIGALLDRATFTDAAIVETDVYGACADAFSFSPAQAKGLCRPAVHVLANGLKVEKPTMSWNVRALEEWKSDAPGIGVGILDLRIPGGWVIGDFYDPALPRRSAEPKELPPSFHLDDPGEMMIHLDRDYLEKAGREELFVQRINRHRVLLMDQLKRERMLKLPG